ncbi:hypothetical protein [Anaerotruncus rubiinfantis]|uniref:hypothetical protein n=1 Tax=Anaerotruncus rubiinfantis TaxID=1720200 RepID=UPI0034A2CCD7
MKQTLRAVLMSACLLLAGCEGRETPPMAQDVSVPASSAEASAPAGGALSPSGSSAPESPAPPAAFSEPAESAPPLYDGVQPDPTLPENQKGPYIMWDHIEYKNFGDPAEWEWHTVTLINYDAEKQGLPPERVEAKLLLPPRCGIDEVIVYDGGFANGTIKIGDIGGYYPEGETLFSAWNVFSAEGNPITGETWEAFESAENEIGAYCCGDRFTRYITPGLGGNVLEYMMDLGEGHFTYLYFYVSASATADDLKLYDMIAQSVKPA